MSRARLGACLAVAMSLVLARETGVVSASYRQEGSLAVQAARARALGKTSLSLGVHFERPLDERFNSIRAHAAFFVATRTTRPPIVVAGPDFIVTWYVLRLEKTLSDPGILRKTLCRDDDLPKEIRLGPAEIAAGILGGTATVAGVTVTMDSRDSQASFEDGRRYLFIGAVCPDRTALLPYGDSSVLPLSRDGTIGQGTARAPFSFVGDILGFKNLAELQRRLEGAL